MLRFQVWMHLYVMGALIFALSLFLVGFFPLKINSGITATYDDLPTSINNLRLNWSELYHRQVNKVVLMVIDALRYDFVHSLNKTEQMPFLTESFTNGNNCILKARVDPPTVTLPRIKALTSGTVPNFIDIVLNFGTSRMQDDNIVRQASLNKLKLVFYGDETWLKLFPGTFDRSEGTTSFFVSDYTEVDQNVTRNLKNELQNADWDILVLHYLGLDHIGHLEGPQSDLVKPKLLEMDKIISEIHNALEIMDKASKFNSRLIVCGDHGMKDTGSHGGASLPEVTVPIVVFNQHCDQMVQFSDVNQIDLVPLLSVFLGLPIPADSVGKLNHKLLKHMRRFPALYALYYNSQRMVNLYFSSTGAPSTDSHEGYLLYQKANELFESWIESNFSNFNFSTAAEFYKMSQESISESIIENSVSFDITLLVVAIIIILQLTTIVSLGFKGPNLLGSFKMFFTALFFVLILEYIFCSSLSSTSMICSLNTRSVTLFVVLSVVLSLNLTFIYSSPKKVKVPFLNNYVLIFGTLLHTLSVASSSYIEEEHQIWYFLFVSLVLRFWRKSIRQVCFLLLVHRALRELNQTGDKWSNEPDFSDWLNLESNKISLSFEYFVALILIMGCCYKALANWIKDPILKLVHIFLLGMQFSFAYLHKVAIGACLLPIFYYPLSSASFEKEMFWTTFMIMLIFHFIWALVYGERKFNYFVNTVIGLTLHCMLLLMALIARPHNAVLLPMMFLFSRILYGFFHKDLEQLTAAHHWLGMLFYFYQGNSNSFANIDIAAGYRGTNEYSAAVSGTLIILHTFAAPMLSYMLLLRHLDEAIMKSWVRVSIYRTMTFLSCLHSLTTCINLLFQRNHLFIWSVFSPKLMYVSAQVAVHAVLIFSTEVLCTVGGLLEGLVPR